MKKRLSNSKLIQLTVLIINLNFLSCQECDLRKVLHEFQLPGCVRKIIPTYGCQGTCNSYVQVSNSKFWEFERSCNCCQDMGQKERTVTIDCPNRESKEIQIVVQAPLGCICRQCTDVNKDLIKPQEYSSLLNYNKQQLKESIAFI